MKNKFTLISLMVLIIVACSTSKKSTTSAPATSASTTPTVAPTPTVAEAPAIPKATKTEDGIYEPGSEELVAIQLKDKDMTYEKLKLGYTLYAKSACISCHQAFNIYRIPQERVLWVVQDMGDRARLTTDQKDAVFKYILAIKATQPMPGMPK